MSTTTHIPALRFEGFFEEWEEKSLENVYNFQYGIYNNNPSNGGEYPVYGANGIIGGFTKYNADTSVVIGHMGEYAGTVLWAKGKHFVTYNGIITTAKLNDFFSIFGFFLLCNLNISKKCGGSGQPFLSYNDLNKIKTMIPSSPPEQKKIGEYFKNLDEFITSQQTQIQKLQQLKKALLSKMFV